ncbi:aspartate kinase [Proteinivorax tanatarense]|uniref:Aspartokinase n=1 Tax=Proteinivorax tanatarense TaxID=1260629 RepID=A0AAU7VQP6_9FIRM
MYKIQKFGGTSVATAIQRKDIAQHVISQIKGQQNLRLVIVVSAMGRAGSPYATDTFLRLLDNYPKTSKSKVDLLLSCGEIISAVLLAAEIELQNVKCDILTGWNMGIKTDDNFTSANIVSVDNTRIKEAFKKVPIVIVPGFQGLTNTERIATLGRGGSDITAVALGNALKAESVEIFTDVDGVMTADPKIVPEALKLKEITYEEIYQMAYGGAKVIHPRAVEMAMKNGLDLWIKPMDFSGTGTFIRNSNKGSINDTAGEEKGLITGIAEIGELVQYSIYFGKDNKKLELEIFQKIADNNVSLDLINLSPDKKIFTIFNKDCEVVSEILREYNLVYEKIEKCSKITIIGTKMKGKPGVMSEILSLLFKSDIPILQTADSHINISILTKSQYAKKAIKEMHKALIK